MIDKNKLLEFINTVYWLIDECEANITFGKNKQEKEVLKKTKKMIEQISKDLLF